jgi:hypothetical protein
MSEIARFESIQVTFKQKFYQVIFFIVLVLKIQICLQYGPFGMSSKLPEW